MSINIIETLTRLGACPKPLAWLALPENIDNSPQSLWETCQRGDWLMWLVTEAGVPRNLVAPAVCDCARMSLQHVPDGEDRPRLCIEAAEDYLRGKATHRRVLAAYRDAVDAGTDYCYPAQDNRQCKTTAEPERLLTTNTDAAAAAAGYASYSAAYAAGYAAKVFDRSDNCGNCRRLGYAFMGSTDSIDYAELAADCLAYAAAGYTDYTGSDCAGYASVNASVNAGAFGGGSLQTRRLSESAGWRSETQAKCAYLIQSRISWQVMQTALNKTTACGGCSELKGYEI